MFRARLIALASFVSLLALILTTFSTVRAAAPVSEARAYQAADGQRPEWASKVEAAGLAHLESKGYARGDYRLRNIESDGVTSQARYEQYAQGVRVFGGDLLVDMDADGKLLNIVGQSFDANGVSVQPKISSALAVKAARTALGYRGELVQDATPELIILADGADAQGAKGGKLVYLVNLHVEADPRLLGRHMYFVDAQSGAIVRYYNDMDTTAATGTGYSLYAGTVSIGTDYTNSTYYLRDLNRGSQETWDMRNGTSSAYYFTDADNKWGTGTTSSTQSAAVDAHYGAALTWDYFLNTYGRRGIDGNGFKVINRVHYSSRYNNAFWNGTYMTYGDGDGSTFSPLTSIDVAGHEITHGLTSKTANLVYSGESGALNEAMSDVFGTMVEYYSGKSPDYLIGEDIYTPGTAGDALRSMSNPGAYGDPDHYSKRYTGTADNGGVHTNSGIVNQAFYLLANGGTNRTSGQSVTGIGNAKAAKIFYRALTAGMTSSTNFKGARTATLNAASYYYGSTSVEYTTVQKAWTAVGVN